MPPLEQFREFLALLGLISFTITREWWKERKERKAKSMAGTDMVSSLSLHIEIDKVLDNIRLLIGANRVHILMFHNGVTSYAGDHFDYCTMTHESVDSDSTSLLIQYQRIPCATFRDDMLKIATNGILEIHSGDNSSLANTHDVFGIRSSYKFRIGDAIRNGVVAVSWRTDKKLTPDQIERIKSEVTKIKLLLDLKRAKVKS